MSQNKAKNRTPYDFMPKYLPTSLFSTFFSLSIFLCLVYISRFIYRKCFFHLFFSSLSSLCSLFCFHFFLHANFLWFLFRFNYSPLHIFLLLYKFISFFLCVHLLHLIFMFETISNTNWDIFGLKTGKTKFYTQKHIHFTLQHTHSNTHTRIFRSSRLYPSGVLIISIEDWCQFTQRQQQPPPPSTHIHHHNYHHHRKWHDTHSTQIIRTIIQCPRHRCFRASRWTQRQRYQYRHDLYAVPFQIKHHPACKSSTTTIFACDCTIVVQSTANPCSSSDPYYSSASNFSIETNAFYFAFVVVFSVVYTAISIFNDWHLWWNLEENRFSFGISIVFLLFLLLHLNINFDL